MNDDPERKQRTRRKKSKTERKTERKTSPSQNLLVHDQNGLVVNVLRHFRHCLHRDDDDARFRKSIKHLKLTSLQLPVEHEVVPVFPDNEGAPRVRHLYRTFVMPVGGCDVLAQDVTALNTVEDCKMLRTIPTKLTRVESCCDRVAVRYPCY